MKNKIITVLILASLILPSISQAVIFVPTANLTIVINTQGQDGVFTFNASDGDQFILQTENLSASQTVSITAFGDQYSLSQEIIDGLSIKDINCTSDYQFDNFSYFSNGTTFFPTDGENITCTFNNVKGKTPILIVPGLMGTEIKNGNELLWANVPKMLIDSSDNFMDPLAFDSNLMPTNFNLFVSDVIAKKTVAFYTTDYTDGLVKQLIGQGYVEDQDLFTFAHDWRYGASGEYANGKTNSDLLGEKIQAIMTQTGSDKVDVVAHSQGGLLVKKYVMEHPADNHIGKAVFVGVPELGAVKSLKVLLLGDSFDISFAKWGLSEAEIKKISANMPAAYDLLPSQQYYDVKGSFVKVVQKDGFTTTQKELNYNEFGNYITNDHQLNGQALASAEGLHTADFDNFDMRTAGVDVYAIDGCKVGTLDSIVENRQNTPLGNVTSGYQMIKFKDGDETVAMQSSTNLPVDQSHIFYTLKTKHSDLLAANGSRQQIVNLLAGSSLEVKPELVTQDITKCGLNGKVIYKHSPINILATDQNGNHSGIADDGTVVNEVPGASVEVFGEQAYIYLPTDEGQTYTTTIQGTGTGTYTIGAQNIVDGEVTGTEVFSNLPVTTDLTGAVNLGTQTTLTVQQDLGSAPETILPSATLDAAASEDVLSPVSTVTLTGSVGQSGFYRSDVNVSLNAIDDNSGVLSISYSIDGAPSATALGADANVLLTIEGVHAVTFFATDKAGNNEQEQTVTFVIDKTAPEAVIQFDPTTKDLKFSAQNDPSVTVSDKDDVINLTDQAGNVTEIKLKGKDRKKSMSAEIKSLKYNGVAVDISKNVMQYKWGIDKKNGLEKLSQHVKSRKDYNVFADFDGKNTVFEGKDQSGKIKKSVSGLKIINITTNKGDFDWSY